MDTNISAYNVSTLSGVQTANSGGNIIGSSATMTINGCEAGKIIFDTVYQGQIAIARLISNNIKRGVYAYGVGVHFSPLDAAHDKTRVGENLTLNDALPMYMVADGVPGARPQAIPFVPR